MFADTPHFRRGRAPAVQHCWWVTTEPPVERQAEPPAATDGAVLAFPSFGQVLRYLPGFALRVLLPVGLVILVLCGVPMAPLSRTGATLADAAFLVVWLLVLFPLYLRWQLRSIHGADSPQTRWLESLIVLGVLFVTIFARSYRLLNDPAITYFTQPMDLLNSMYYSMTVLSTIGFGDIAPVAPAAKILTMVQMVGDIALIGLVVRVLSTAARRASSTR